MWFVGGFATLAQTATEGSAAVLDRTAVLLGVGAALLTAFALPARSAVSGWLGPWAWPQAVADGLPPGWLAVAGLVAVGTAGLALVRLDRVRLASLVTGGLLADTVATGLVTLDSATAAGAVEQRRWAGRSPRRTGLPRWAGRSPYSGTTSRRCGARPTGWP